MLQTLTTPSCWPPVSGLSGPPNLSLQKQLWWVGTASMLGIIWAGGIGWCIVQLDTFHQIRFSWFSNSIFFVGYHIFQAPGDSCARAHIFLSDVQ